MLLHVSTCHGISHLNRVDPKAVYLGSPFHTLQYSRLCIFIMDLRLVYIFFWHVLLLVPLAMEDSENRRQQQAREWVLCCIRWLTAQQRMKHNRITVTGDELCLSTWVIHFTQWPMNKNRGRTAPHLSSQNPWRHLDHALPFVWLITFHMLSMRHMICRCITSLQLN